MPTYKWYPNVNEFLNKKEQAPSFTDRILVKENASLEVKIEKYDGMYHIHGSDHRPVFAHVSLNKNQMKFGSLPPHPEI